jgi:transposase-like protein
MFEPPRCPYVTCARHREPDGRFFTRRGFYRAACRPHPVPRFRCKTCLRTFSRQTFRADFRDRKPHLNTQVIKYQCSGVGLRQAARMVGLTRNNLEAKARKISRNARRLDLNLKGRAAARGSDTPDAEPQEIHFDEFETYETRRNTRPLSIAVLIESRTRFLVAAMAAPIRPRGTMTKQRLAAIAAEDAAFGRRKDRSDIVCRSAFRRAAKLRPQAGSVILLSDEKSTYPRYLAEAYRGREVTHLQTPSVMHRDEANPLFPINHTEALMRDLVGRLRRESWLVSKMRKYLNLQLGLYGAWRNWVRPRFNRDTQSPGQLAGFATRRLRIAELVGWRQDWGLLSPCPFGSGTESVGDGA